MKKKNKQLLIAGLVATIGFGVAAQLPLQAKASTEIAESQEDLPELTDEEKAELLQLQLDLQDAGITSQELADGLKAEFPEGTFEGTSTTPPGTMTTMGVKSQTAKVAAKAMLKTLGRIGKVAWDRTVTTYINKLPINKASKTVLKKYLKYDIVFKVLNAVIGFGGTITTGLSNQFQKMGMPTWLANTAARTIVMILF